MCWQGNDCSGDRKDARNASKDFMVRHARSTNYLAVGERKFVDFHIQLREFLLFTVVGAASVPGFSFRSKSLSSVKSLMFGRKNH
jgi:hypothetical protein